MRSTIISDKPVDLGLLAQLSIRSLIMASCTTAYALSDHHRSRLINPSKRDGRGITLEELRQASMEVYNIDIFLAQLFTTGGNLVVQNDTFAGIFQQTVDLSDFDKHDAIEHDGSLTRKDWSQGDASSFQPALLQALLDDSSTDVLDFNTLGKSRARREKDMAARGLPPLDGKGNFIAYGESALILETFGQGTGMAPKAAVKTFFEEERLPDGYQKPAQLITIPSTVALSAEIQAAAQFYKMFGKKKRNFLS